VELKSNPIMRISMRTRAYRQPSHVSPEAYVPSNILQGQLALLSSSIGCFRRLGSRQCNRKK
jgi:hypothetical protein